MNNNNTKHSHNNSMIVIILILCCHLGVKYCTLDINTSEILMDCQWLSVAFSNIISNCQRYALKDCHLPRELSLELSNGFSVACSNGMFLLWFPVCKILPWHLQRREPREGQEVPIRGYDYDFTTFKFRKETMKTCFVVWNHSWCNCKYDC